MRAQKREQRHASVHDSFDAAKVMYRKMHRWSISSLAVFFHVRRGMNKKTFVECPPPPYEISSVVNPG